jgi:hypothetical protein
MFLGYDLSSYFKAIAWVYDLRLILKIMFKDNI